MKTTTELLQQLNTIQTQHIKVLEERIDVLNETIIEEVKRYDNALQPLEAQYEQLNTMQTNHIKVMEERIEVLKRTIEIDKQNIFNTLVNQLKGEREFNPKMNMTDAQINDLAQDVKDSSNCE